MSTEVLEQLSQREEINFMKEYVVKFNGKEISLDDYLAVKEEEAILFFSK
ncbi:hypothetical protein [Tepidibacillus fermentans]|uniref:Uncharacterized protein n=1 Tax=Tepidibacillus fermentans TaxID=1281767 RepID=A0A4R3KD36_9BACI|nr:hypothetical protein [Tepidibacillus fermentans]TCS81038.1 hypothetical protein EDD72_11415 [Tepidibacillus fermentans]